VRTLKDRNALLSHLAADAEARGHPRSAHQFRRQGELCGEQAELISEVVRRLTEADVGNPLGEIEEIEG